MRDVDVALVEIYKRVLKHDANMYMSENGWVIFVTWVEKMKGKFRRSGEGDMDRIRKVAVRVTYGGRLKLRRMM